MTFPPCSTCGEHPEVIDLAGGGVTMQHACTDATVRWPRMRDRRDAAARWRMTYARNSATPSDAGLCGLARREAGREETR